MRARGVKPGFFQNETLAELEPWVRLLFLGLWLYADRAGRFELRPKRIAAALFPYDAFPVADGIATLARAGFVTLYAGPDGEPLACIPGFAEHQNPHHREAPSKLPAPGEPRASLGPSPEEARPSRADSLILDSLTPDSLTVDRKDKQRATLRDALDSPRLVLPEWMPVDLWKRWHEYRKTRGKGWSVDAQRLSLRTLDKWRQQGHEPLAVIEQSIERGWTGLFAIKDDNGGGNGRDTRRGQGVADRTIAHARRHGIV